MNELPAESFGSLAVSSTIQKVIAIHLKTVASCL